MTRKPDPRLVSKTVCHKLECLEDFLKGFASSGATRNYCYLEIFARPGKFICHESGAQISSLSSRASDIKPGFGRMVMAAQNEEALENFSNINGLIVSGNILHDSVQRKIFDQIPRSSNILCVIDPPGYRRLRWSTMKKMISGSTNWQGQRMDALLILPLENALFKNMGRVECASSINRFFGTNEWQNTAGELAAGRISPLKARLEMVNLYAENLKSQGYRHVEVFNPAKPGRMSAYFIIWTSDTSSRIKQIKNIWQKTRFLPGEMFHQS